jgi:hypothetical protein
VILTYGGNNTLYLGDGVQMPVHLLWRKYFEANKCPTLAGKPKLFILQVNILGLMMFRTVIRFIILLTNCASQTGYHIQACRAEQAKYGGISFGISKFMDNEAFAHKKAQDETDSSSFSYIIPNSADILAAFSCPDRKLP